MNHILLRNIFLAVASLIIFGGTLYSLSQFQPLTEKTDSLSEIASLHQDDVRCDAGGCQELTPEQSYILRDKGTEAPFSSSLHNEHRKGTYVSADNNEPVFRSEQKFDSGTGWPSFWAPISPDAIQTDADVSLGIGRTEVLSSGGGHLGHVFRDGPEPTGLRYCINGDALKFIPDENQ